MVYPPAIVPQRNRAQGPRPRPRHPAQGLPKLPHIVHVEKKFLRERQPGKTTGHHPKHTREDGGILSALPALGRDGARERALVPKSIKRHLVVGVYDSTTSLHVASAPAEEWSSCPVSKEMDRKIVTHLRRKLNRRMHKRTNQVLQGDFGLQDSEDESNLNDKSRINSRAGERVDIFNSYTDFGDKVKRFPPISHKTGWRHTQSSPIQHGNVADHSLKGYRDSQTHLELSEEDNKKPTILPDINSKQETLASDGAVRQEGKGTEPGDIEKDSPDDQPGDEHEGEVEILQEPIQEGMIDREASVFTLTRVKTGNGTVEPELVKLNEEEVEEETGPSGNFHDLVVSPVPTPMVSRPETRDHGRLSTREKIVKILRGHMNIKLQPEPKICRLFISSASTDSEMERSMLIERIFPGLHTHFLERGYDLQMIDIHWGHRDLTLDDHSQADLVQRLIDKCQENPNGINFITFLGQKYGDPILPAEILQDEFELIMKEVELEHQRQMEEEIAIAEARRRAEEMRRRLHSDEDEEQDYCVDVPASGLREGSDLSGRLGPLGRKSFSLQVGRTQRGDVESARSRQTDPQLLSTWYRLDENADPPAYRLQPISSNIKEFLARDAGRRSQARNQWFKIQHRLSSVLYETAKRVLPDQSACSRYKTSVQDLELQHGVLYSGQGQRCLWIRREIEDIQNGLQDQPARDYLDLSAMDNQPDRYLAHALSELRHNDLPQNIPVQNIWKYEIPWHPTGINPSVTRPHQVYLERMCKTVYDVTTRGLAFAMQGAAEFADLKSELFQEVHQHVHFCHSRSRTFQGRKDVLQLIKRYVRSDCTFPLVIHGKSGSGKTSLMAKAAKESYKWLKGRAAVIVRMIGVTPDSTNIRLLLQSLCLQMCQLTDHNAGDLPTDYKGLVNDFNFRLTLANEERPLVVILDSLDKLSVDNDARRLAWLPKELPKHVKIVVSTLPEEKYECLGNLKKIIADRPECFLQVPNLPLEDANAILKHWFGSTSRTLTSEQRDFLLSSFEQCPLPLYLRLAFHESLRWPSYTAVEDIKLATTVSKLVTVVFGRLERDHGEPLVRRALGFLTASRNGVTDNEMQDLLSLDEVVMDDIGTYARLQLRRLPPVYWVRLRDALGEYIQEVNADQCITLRWAHVLFHDAAKDRYLDQRDRAPSYHKAMAEYFLDLWSGKPKPHGGNEKGSLRFVTPQPLFRKIQDQSDGSMKCVYNLRQLNELPYHLLHSQQMDQLKSKCLCNFEWVLAKISGTSLRELFDDISMALGTEPADADLRLLSDMLQLSSGPLSRDPSQLASQVVGRLCSIVTKDVPVAPGDPVKYPAMKPFLRAAKTPVAPSLIPSTSCLSAPGGILFDLLSGHTESLTAVALTSDGQRAITTSSDNTLKLWELRTARVILTIMDVGSDVLSICMGCNNAVAVTSEKTCIRVWSMRSGEVLKTMTDYEDPAIITTAAEGTVLVALFDGSQMMRTWDLQKPEIPLLQEIEVDEGAIHKDHSFVVANNCQGPSVLYALRSSNQATSRNVRTGIVQHQPMLPSGSICALGLTRDYYVLVAKLQYMVLHEIAQLELFDIKTGQYVRGVRGCVGDINVQEIYINNIGSHALAICASEANCMSDIAVWNIETQDHKHLAKHAAVSDFGACLDMRFCLTAARGENALRMWNLSGKVNQPGLKENVKEGLDTIIPMVDYPRYVITKSINQGPLAVWNITKGGFSGKCMAVERGLAESSDILLVKNSTVVILSDKGFSGVSEDGRPVFQSVMLYDILEKKYKPKLTGCYIVPCLAHEYVILDDEHLMGLSENRNHFVIWSLVTGHAAHRIKSNFRTLDRKRTDPNFNLGREDEFLRKRNQTAKMTPWERRNETKTARKRRHRQEIEEEKARIESLRHEKDNSIEQFLISSDLKVLVASYFGHHLCVFDIPGLKHTQTLENLDSMLYLHVAALTPNGSHLVHANYDDSNKVSYITLWDCETGSVQRRLRNERNVRAIAISDQAEKVVFGKSNRELRIWEPMHGNCMKKIRGYASLNFEVGSQIHITDQGRQAVVFAGDISVWDLERACVLTVFSPDMRIQCFNVAMDGRLCLLGLRDTPDIVTLRLTGHGSKKLTKPGNKLYAEDSSSDESDDEPEQEASSEKN